LSSTAQNPFSDEDLIDNFYKKAFHKDRVIPDLIIGLSFLSDLHTTVLSPSSITKCTFSLPDNSANLKTLTRDSVARIMYEFRLETGQLLDKTRNRKESRRVKLFNDNYIPGIHEAVSTMKPGEISWFKFPPEYHFGPEGHSAQGLQPKAPLYCKVELESFVPQKINV